MTDRRMGPQFRRFWRIILGWLRMMEEVAGTSDLHRIDRRVRALEARESRRPGSADWRGDRR